MSSTLDPLAAPRPGLVERVATARRYLMCPPTYFAVSYSINPWMDPSKPVDRRRAMTQWRRLVEIYRGLGHTVELVEPMPGLPDMVFAANSGTVIGGRVFGARFRSRHRAAEAAYFVRWFLDHGYSDLVIPQAVNEAEGDFLWTGRVLLAGTGFRTDPAAHGEVADALGVSVVPLRLVDPRYYHLDTCLAVLDDSPDGPLVAYYPQAFSPSARRTLARMFPDAVIATRRDAECLGVNAVSDGRFVVLPTGATDLGGALAERGFEPVYVDVSELLLAGGGPKCCTMELRTAA